MHACIDDGPLKELIEAAGTEGTCDFDPDHNSVAQVLNGKAMTEVCQEFGISRKTGYKILDRSRARA